MPCSSGTSTTRERLASGTLNPNPRARRHPPRRVPRRLPGRRRRRRRLARRRLRRRRGARPRRRRLSMRIHPRRPRRTRPRPRVRPARSVATHHRPGEDRTFAAWDVVAGAATHRSAILGAAVPTSVSVDPTYPRAAIGAADGTIRFFDLGTPGCSPIRALDLAAASRRACAVAAVAGRRFDGGGIERNRQSRTRRRTSERASGVETTRTRGARASSARERRRRARRMERVHGD